MKAWVANKINVSVNIPKSCDYDVIRSVYTKCLFHTNVGIQTMRSCAYVPDNPEAKYRQLYYKHIPIAYTTTKIHFGLSERLVFYHFKCLNRFRIGLWLKWMLLFISHQLLLSPCPRFSRSLAFYFFSSTLALFSLFNLALY